MSNCLVRLRWTLDIPEEKLAQLVGQPDDGSEEWHQQSGDKAKAYVEDNLMDAISEYGHRYEPDVEVD